MGNNTTIEPTKLPKFSVVIPTYNSGKYLLRAMQSVFDQSFRDYEIIVVDDASTDDTEQLIAPFLDKVSYIRKIYNSGSAIARNAGIDVAKGDFIAFLDADDSWHPDKLLVINTILEGANGIKIMYHSYSLAETFAAIPENITLYKLPYVKLLLHNRIATPCAVVKRELGYRFEASMRYSEDYDLWLRIGYKHNVYFINVPLTKLYRPINSSGGVSAHKWKMRKGELKAYTRLVKLNPFFMLLLPFLYTSSIIRHLLKFIWD